MPTFYEACLRHAKYYERVLDKTNTLYKKGGGNFNRALRQFSVEWTNIEAGQSWAEAESEKSEAAAHLCNAYPAIGNLLD